mmetsp:Transcript_15889/g.33093  ORF Transcript_15889/g.33093 Transcript_15889/m.33093 type:complete len:206 (+) Transcript_15889:990-1607(+)
MLGLPEAVHGRRGQTCSEAFQTWLPQEGAVETARRRRKETLEAAFHRKSRVLCGQFADPVSSGPHGRFGRWRRVGPRLIEFLPRMPWRTSIWHQVVRQRRHGTRGASHAPRRTDGFIVQVATDRAAQVAAARPGTFGASRTHQTRRARGWHTDGAAGAIIGIAFEGCALCGPSCGGQQHVQEPTQGIGWEECCVRRVDSFQQGVA